VQQTVAIAEELLREFPAMNGAQRAVVAHNQGPLLVIAGPGSGKTFSLVLRALNLLLLGLAYPSQLILCTFTEKAAYELRDRIAAAAAKVGYKGDLSTLRVGTIHSICNQLLHDHRHRTQLGNNYQVLDDLSQQLFINESFREICGSDGAAVGSPDFKYFGRWRGKWTTIKTLQEYFNKVTEELISPDDLLKSPNPFVRELGTAYHAYRGQLFERNCIDFSHQQALVHELLSDAETRDRITAAIRYVLVDEYQDTNYVQEQVLTQLASAANNLTVVGDEDQSLYRFRGATVRNLLEFPQRFPDHQKVQLTTNYRSHDGIISAYDTWMASANWFNLAGPPFRFDKTISPDPDATFPTYPAVFSIYGTSKHDEAQRFADLVLYLKQQNIIEDYSQVALLLRSVQSHHSGPYLDALAAHAIPAYCPRARAYFDNEEIRLLVGAFAVIFGY
jgi:DNA helicase-2/ATP-dependent DNA helicase PcrA